MHNQEERLNQLSQMTKHVREERKKLNAVTPELKERALHECRAVHEAALLKQSKDNDSSSQIKHKGSTAKSKSSKKKSAKNKKKNEEDKTLFTPTAPQLAAMIEDLKLRNEIKIDVVIDNNMGLEEEDSHDDTASAVTSLAMTARTTLAQLDRKRKEKEKILLMKKDAIAWLEQALETERERDIKDALKYARQADLEGVLEDGRTFCTALMFKVCW